MSAHATGSVPVGDDPGDVQIAAVLPAQLVAAVHHLVDAATAADGVPPLSEHVTLHLRHGGEGPDRHLLVALPGGGLAGYAHLDPTDQVAGAAAELVVHPAHRGRGLGRRLVAAAERLSPAGRLRLWAHGDHRAARRLALALGYHEIRRLEQWRRSLFPPLPAAQVPAGVTLRPFRPGTDDSAWLALNARAFAGHPEQGGWTERDLHARTAEGWFDPDGFLLAEEDGELIGFHWTKVHGGTTQGDGAAGHAHDPIGEVYVVGVDPRQQGRGLGRALTVAGLARLRSQGLAQAMLYVESDNTPARATYTSLGFTHWDTDVMFSRELHDHTG
ncbi:MAG TPA: mycothiol synthase [Kineosporiaceae bacterium]